MATPLTTWFALSVIDATAWISENKAEITIATTIDTHGVHTPSTSLKVRSKTIPTNATMIIKPYSTILMTPDRSLQTPPSAVNIRGAEKNRAVGIIDCSTSIIHPPPLRSDVISSVSNNLLPQEI